MKSKVNKGIFNLVTNYQPAGSQPEAIDLLSANRNSKSVLLGVTGSGKTFTLAHVIAKQHKPVLILSPNKTLAAQLYEEFSSFFPENKVCYFVSYYDYYQPESYLPAQDIYVAKETKINSEIERLRIDTTASIVTRPDTIVIASVSAIYSLGNPADWRDVAFSLHIGQKLSRKELIDKLIALQFTRNDTSQESGMFQVMGSTITICLSYQRHRLRIELFGSQVELLVLLKRHANNVVQSINDIHILPAKHFVTSREKIDAAIVAIKKDLVSEMQTIENPLVRQRLSTRVSHDIEMLQEVGYCSGIENYSRYFNGHRPGQAPYCLFDFFDDDFLLILDESHIAIPQLHGMYKGDRARKKALVDFGFRLTSAYDNRPLKFEEIEKYFKDVIFVSATPGDYELKICNLIAEQIVRPTGIVDPMIEIHGRENQIDHLLAAIKETSIKGFRTLVTVLTKKMAEQLATYLEQRGIKVCYLHSEIKTPERTQILQKLRAGVFECLVGINLLREGLDLPEVALVAIMDADIEGFLRNARSLIQTIGRAARNTQSKVLFYADKITASIKAALDETQRRRHMQLAYNKEHGITARNVQREVTKSITPMQQAIMDACSNNKRKRRTQSKKVIEKSIISLEREMLSAAENRDYERAIELREQLKQIRSKLTSDDSEI